MEVKEILESAITNSEKIEIIYDGGSQAGKKRSIAPLSIKNDRVRASCYNSEKVKVFLISKIRLATDQSSTIMSNWEPGAKFEFSNLKEFHKAYKDSFESSGWVIVFEDECLALHGKFKNGKTRATPEIQLSYSEYVVDLFVEASGKLDGEERISTRPWALRAKNFDTLTYGKFESAVSRFLQLVKERSF